jgi:hypothetical protein
MRSQSEPHAYLEESLGDGGNVQLATLAHLAILEMQNVRRNGIVQLSPESGALSNMIDGLVAIARGAERPDMVAKILSLDPTAPAATVDLVLDASPVRRLEILEKARRALGASLPLSGHGHWTAEMLEQNASHAIVNPLKRSRLPIALLSAAKKTLLPSSTLVAA